MASILIAEVCTAESCGLKQRCLLKLMLDMRSHTRLGVSFEFLLSLSQSQGPVTPRELKDKLKPQVINLPIFNAFFFVSSGVSLPYHPYRPYHNKGDIL